MPGTKPPKRVGRGYERDLDVGPFRPMTDSFDLHLRAERKSPKTIRVYVDAVLWFAAVYLIPAELSDWSEVKGRHVQQWVTTLLADYSDSYANNQFRALQQFFKWYATEDPDEPRPNAMANLRPPKIGDKLVPVISDDELNALLAACKGGGFENRRDYAVISIFKDTGARLSEVAGLAVDDVAAREREATVTGKGITKYGSDPPYLGIGGVLPAELGGVGGQVLDVCVGEVGGLDAAGDAGFGEQPGHAACKRVDGRGGVACCCPAVPEHGVGG